MNACTKQTLLLAVLLLASVSVLTAAVSRPQTAATSPQFEVVSIRPVISPRPIMREYGWTPFLPGGKFSDPSINLIGLIASAYGIRLPELLIQGLPGWGTTSQFAIQATPGDALNGVPEQEQHAMVLLMLRQMLADRFRLQIHVEDRTVDVYELRLAGSELKNMTPGPPGIARPGVYPGLNAGIGDSGGGMIGNGASLQQIGEGLTIFLRRPVLDKTGVTGFYNFDIHWKSENVSAAAGLGDEGIALLISELRNQLGLRLTSAKGVQRFWVIDHAEKPSDPGGR